jgi:hypothetical protein
MRTGDTVHWAVIDPVTLEVLILVATRSKAREYAAVADARVGRVLVAK